MRLNCQPTAPGSAIVPPSLLKTLRTSEPVRLRLSVSTSTRSADAAGGVTLVGDRLVGAAVALAGAALDRPVDRVVGHLTRALAL